MAIEHPDPEGQESPSGDGASGLVPGDYMPLEQISDTDGPYRSRLSLRLTDGTSLEGDEAQNYLRSIASTHDDH